MPSCYLEGFKTLRQQALSHSFPTNPKFIFTSNNFSTDEIFKVWTAEKVNQGIPYYVGQHGANYGTYFDSESWPEITSCDKFFSWGWSKVYNNVNTEPAFNFKIANSKNIKYKKNGCLLIIERSPGSRDGVRDRYYERKKQHDDATKLYSLLPKYVKNKTIIRLHHGVLERKSYEKDDWCNKFDNIIIDDGKTRLNKLVENSRLLVFNYDSAGLLEYLGLNIPVICFWEKGFDHLLPSAKPYYQLLKDAGIYLETPDKVSKHISYNWDSIDKWWYSESVQEARIKFCKRYSRVVENPIRFFKKILTDG